MLAGTDLLVVLVWRYEIFFMTLLPDVNLQLLKLCLRPFSFLYISFCSQSIQLEFTTVVTVWTECCSFYLIFDIILIFSIMDAKRSTGVISHKRPVIECLKLSLEMQHLSVTHTVCSKCVLSDHCRTHMLWIDTTVSLFFKL